MRTKEKGWASLNSVLRRRNAEFWRRESGTTFMELVVLVVILGVVIPAVIGLFSQMSLYHARNQAIHRCINLANSKMEEIIAYKELNTNWDDDISDFAGSETINGYTRTVTITYINNWVITGADAYEVKISVSHSVTNRPYVLSTTLAIVN